MNSLTITGIITEGAVTGLKNAASLCAALFLWVITIWVPYINVGTTIGMVNLVANMGKGIIMAPTDIFKAEYRKYMGEFFLLVAFAGSGIFAGFLFFIIPGIVIATAWGQSVYLMFDKELGPLEAIKESNRITYGNKWTIFLGLLTLSLIFSVISAVLVSLLDAILPQLKEFAGFIVGLFGAVAGLGARAYIYGTLTGQYKAADVNAVGQTFETE
ncbi:MAG: hypothetical protein ACLFQK_02145 [Fibrobacterota bacterium]